MSFNYKKYGEIIVRKVSPSKYNEKVMQAELTQVITIQKLNQSYGNSLSDELFTPEEFGIVESEYKHTRVTWINVSLGNTVETVQRDICKYKKDKDENGWYYKLEGNWVEGFAFDIHTKSSKHLGKDKYGHDKYDTLYSDMGKFVYQLKYKNDLSVVTKIVDMLQEIKGFEKIDVIVPIPPSNKNRHNQPVDIIAKELGIRFGIAVYIDVIGKFKNSKELKKIEDPEERKEELKNSMHIANNYDLSGKNILLIDDLYRSGSTLEIATELLYSDKINAKNIYVLTMTNTRKNR